MRFQNSTVPFRYAFLGLLFSIPLILVVQGDATASSCRIPDFSLSEAYGASDSIIVGLVTDCVDKASGVSRVLRRKKCSFVSLEVLKESEVPRDYSGVATSSECALPLTTGQENLLFLDQDNQPLYYSGRIDKRDFGGRMQRYVSILRRYRDGLLGDLSEPWNFADTGISCALSQRIKDNVIAFGLMYADPAILMRRGLNVTFVQGQVRFELGHGQSQSAEASFPKRRTNADVVSDLRDDPVDALRLKVDLGETGPDVVREATIAVGERSWKLFRTQRSVGDATDRRQSRSEYGIGGETAQEILDAMTKPEDVLVTATRVASPSAGVDTYDELQASNVEHVLRLTTRTTHLAEPLGEFRACVDGSKRRPAE